MRTTTDLYRQILASGNTRKFNVKINMTLADETELELTEEDIWADSFEINTASSGTTSFDIGSAIIGECKFSLNNFDERFNSYDFFNASAVVWLKLIGDSTYYRMGKFTVDEPVFSGALIQIDMLDDMWKFDAPLSEVNLTFPITCQNAVVAVCSYCGVTLSASDFHGYNFILPVEPEEDMNCREFLQYVAMIGCNFCVINSNSALEIRWYDTTPVEDSLDGGTFNTNTTPYSDGDTADGGNFLDYTGGDSYDGGAFVVSGVDYFTRNFSTQLGTDEIEITGVKFVIDNTEYSVGTSGYVLELENPLVTVDTVSTVLNLIWDVLEGFTLRTFNISTLSDLAAEVGDRCAIMDLKGNIVYSFITSIDFGLSQQTVRCDAETVTRALTKRYSSAVKTAVEVARKVADDKITDYDTAVQLMNDLAINAMGAYQNYEDLSTGGRIYYLSNMPITKTGGQCSFETGSTVFKISGDGFFVSTNGGTSWANGYNANTGQLVVNVLNAVGISADWIKTGTMSADYIYGGMLRIGGEEDSAIYAIPSSSTVITNGSITQDTSVSITGNLFSQVGNYVITLTFNTNTDVQAKIYDSVLSRYVETKRTSDGFINLETVFNIATLDNTEYYKIDLKHYTGVDYTYSIRAYGYVTKIDKNGILTTYLNAMGGSFKGHLEAITGNFGIMEIDSTDPNNPFIKIPSDIIIGEIERDYKKSFNKTFYFNPYTEGWDDDGHITYDFYSDDSDLPWVCRMYLQSRTSTSSWSTAETIYLDANGQAVKRVKEGGVWVWVEDPDHDGEFNTLINHLWGKNTGEKYRVRVYIKYDSYWSPDTMNAHLDLYVEDAYTVSKISQQEIVGDLRGKFRGSAMLTDLTLGDDWSFDEVNSALNYYDGESKQTTIGANGIDIYDGDTGEHTVHSDTEVYFNDGNSNGSQLNISRLHFFDSNNNDLDIQNFDITRYYNSTSEQVSWVQASDERVKDEVETLDKNLSVRLIDATAPKKFKYKTKDGKHYGMIAQEARKLLDDLGETDSMLEYSQGNLNVKDQRAIRYEEYIPHLINYVKMLKAEIETLKEALNGYTDEKG